jgi:hypothetical protein
MVAHTFNPSTWEAEAGEFSEFEARVSSRTAKVTFKKKKNNNSVLKKIIFLNVVFIEAFYNVNKL